jgi:hypothetical protein
MLPAGTPPFQRFISLIEVASCPRQPTPTIYLHNKVVHQHSTHAEKYLFGDGRDLKTII